ncbi:lysase, partial [Sarracenia purpurea var. burkii]
VFRNFKDETWNFKAYIYEDIKGLLSLYEATYFSFEGESIFEKAKDFTTKILKESLKVKDIDEGLAIIVSHALELPLHWRMPRLEARWWKSTELGESLNFARDRVVENLLWTVRLDFNPKSSNHRKNLTIVNALITTINDVYDVYDTLDELELFTKAVERWDINALEQLPAYMKICFLALFNSINETGYETLKKQGNIIIPYLQKAGEMKRGDVHKSVQCYMYESGASEEEAHENIKYLVSETWMKMNEVQPTSSPSSKILRELQRTLPGWLNACTNMEMAMAVKMVRHKIESCHF